MSPQPAGETGGVDLHVADLAAAQAASQDVRPVVVELGAKGYSRAVAARGVDALTVTRPYRRDVFRQVSAVAEHHHADVLHSHGYDADFIAAGAWLRRRRQPAFVTTMHGLIWKPAPNTVKTVANLAVLGLGAVIATSGYRARWLARWLPALDGRFVPNGVYMAPVSRRPRGGRNPVIAYVGRLSAEKRVDIVITACALLVDAFPGIECKIVGSGDDDPRLHLLARSIGVDDRVRFVGLVADMATVLADIDALLLLSDTEGTPRVVEAMALGVPIVATDVGGIPDLVPNGREAIVTARGDARAAAGAVRGLLIDQRLADSLVAEAQRRYLAALTVDHMHDQVLQVYKRAVAGAGHRWG